LKRNYCNAEGCSSHKSNLGEKFEKTKFYSWKVITARTGIIHKNTENNAFFFIDQSINQSINYILGVFQINDSEIISFSLINITQNLLWKKAPMTIIFYRVAK